MSSEPDTLPRAAARSALASALSVYVEPLASDARVAVLGDASNGLAESFLDLGARTVHLFDPDEARAARAAESIPRGVAVRALTPGDLDVRDGAYDLVVIPDLALVPDAARTVGRLRRVVDARGAVVALARARIAAPDDVAGESFDDVVASDFSYAELYDLFANRFDDVSMTGVLPFEGIVFAELGGSEDVAVSVDTRLAESPLPSLFVVVAGRGASALDPYAIVQVAAAPVAPPGRGARASGDPALVAAAQLRADLLHAQLEEQRARVVVAESRGGDNTTRLLRALETSQAEVEGLRDAAARAETVIARVTIERDAMTLRSAELETALVQVQQTMLLLERRLASAEQGILERDDVIATLNAELDTRAQEDDEEERGALAAETEALEAQLRDRARLVAELEKEIGRRDQLVRELVAAVEELRAGRAPAEPPPLPNLDHEELGRVRRKADELALEVARRESELVAQGWRIQDLESRDRARAAEPPPVTLPSVPPPAPPPAAADANGATHSEALSTALARAEEEIAALRQALTQEHAARVAAESGEELERARAELARQAVLLSQLESRLRTTS